METKITQDKTQTRSTIPKKMVEKHNVTKKDSIVWNDKGGKLKGVLKTHKEFMEDAKFANSLPAQTARALAPESQEDYNTYAKCESSEVKE